MLRQLKRLPASCARVIQPTATFCMVKMCSQASKSDMSKSAMSKSAIDKPTDLYDHASA